VFLDETRLLSEFRFRAGEEEALIHPILIGQLAREQSVFSGKLEKFGCRQTPPREGFAEAGDRSVIGGLWSATEPFLPSPAIRIEQLSGPSARASVSLRPYWMTEGVATATVNATRDGTAGDETEPSASNTGGGARVASPSKLSGVDGKAIFFQFDLGDVTVPAPSATESELVLTFVTELAVATYLHPKLDWQGPPPISDLGNVAGAAARSRAAFLERIEARQSPQVSPAGQDRAWRARWALTRTGYQARGPAGEFGALIASTCVPSSGGFTRAFFWDALFASAAISRFAPEFARGAIAAEFVRQKADGHCPEHSFNYHVAGRNVIGAPQAPVASWAVEKYLQSNPDDSAFLAEIYPTLVRNHSYWEVMGDKDRDGLAEWTWSGQTADNSPLWDEVKPAKMAGGCNWLPPIASVQLNSFLYRDATILAELAQRQGLSEDADRYRERAEALQDALMRVCYVEEERRFWDYNHATDRYTRIKTFYMFWPIWAGMSVPQETKRDLIDNVLLDPNQFFGPVPFPSVAYDEPTYVPSGRGSYWRGKAWPQITYWLIEMLETEGYHDAADEAARRFVAVYDREPSFPENAATDPSEYAAGGVADYNWGVAAYYLLTTAAYRTR
jgi:hypothetical protein